MRPLLLVLLLSSWTPALAQEKAPRRIQAFLVPLDEDARTPTVRMARALADVLTGAPGYEVVDVGRSMKVGPTHADEPLFDQPRAETAGAEDGSLEVEVRPAGARIFLDGERREPPIEAPAGKHLLEVERAGFYPHSELIELSPQRPVKVSITLEATPAAIRLNQLIAGAVEEAGRGIAGANLAALAQEFSLDRVLVGSVRTQEDGRTSAVLALVDAGRRRVIGSRTVLAIAGAIQLEAAAQAAARELIAAEEVSSVPPKAEPKRSQAAERERPASLRAKTGTEDWDE